MAIKERDGKFYRDILELAWKWNYCFPPRPFRSSFSEELEIRERGWTPYFRGYSFLLVRNSIQSLGRDQCRAHGAFVCRPFKIALRGRSCEGLPRRRTFPAGRNSNFSPLRRRAKGEPDTLLCAGRITLDHPRGVVMDWAFGNFFALSRIWLQWTVKENSLLVKYLVQLQRSPYNYINNYTCIAK